MPGLVSSRICCIGGGTGLRTLLSGLRHEQPHAELSAVVTMMDSGGSTGRLRAELGTLAVGDVRQCLVALSDAPEELQQLMAYRFDAGDSLRGHSLGNLVLTAARGLTGGEYEAIQLLEQVLQVRGHVIPVTLDNCQLVAELADGREVVGEAYIDTRGAGMPIARVRVQPRANLFPRAARALLGADYVVLGPGDLYTSILPNLVVDGAVDALREARRRGVRLVYVVNTMTKCGETDHYTAARFVDVLEGALDGVGLDAIVVNTGLVSEAVAAAYRAEDAELVVNDLVEAERVVVTGDLLGREAHARHDPRRLARALGVAFRRLPARTPENRDIERGDEGLESSE